MTDVLCMILISVNIFALWYHLKGDRWCIPFVIPYVLFIASLIGLLGLATFNCGKKVDRVDTYAINERQYDECGTQCSIQHNPQQVSQFIVEDEGKIVNTTALFGVFVDIDECWVEKTIFDNTNYGVTCILCRYKYRYDLKCFE